MDAFESVLRGPGSELQRLLRASLYGLKSTLETALASLPDDPATPSGRECLDSLRRVLECSPTAGTPDSFAGYVGFELASEPSNAIDTSNVPEEKAWSAQAETLTASGWPILVRNWQRSAQWIAVFGSTTTEALSKLPARDLWMLTLRAPPDLSQQWQDAWRQTRGRLAGAGLTQSWIGPTETVLLPGTEDDGTEVRLSPSGRIPEPLTGFSPGPLAKAMLPPVAACLLWVEQDDSLLHMLRSLFRFGLTPLTEGNRGQCRSVLTERFQQLIEAEAEGEAAQVVLSWVALDEAIHSVVHLPPAHPQSAFASVGKASRSQIDAVRSYAYSAGVQVHLQVLSGSYANLRGSTDPEADVEITEGGAPGEVVLCTRVLLRLNGECHPGRVIYRPR